MTQELATIELGDSHFYLLSDVMAIKMTEYCQMSSEVRADICTATSKFGEEIPNFLISKIKGFPEKDYFYGRRRFWAGQKSKYRNSKEAVTLTDDIRGLYKTVRHHCELHNNGDRVFIVIPKDKLDEPDVQTLVAYIQFTK